MRVALSRVHRSPRRHIPGERGESVGESARRAGRGTHISQEQIVIEIHMRMTHSQLTTQGGKRQATGNERPPWLHPDPANETTIRLSLDQT